MYEHKDMTDDMNHWSQFLLRGTIVDLQIDNVGSRQGCIIRLDHAPKNRTMSDTSIQTYAGVEAIHFVWRGNLRNYENANDQAKGQFIETYSPDEISRINGSELIL